MSEGPRPVRRLMRLQRDFLCEIVATDQSVEGRTLNLNHQGIAVALAEPLSGHLDIVTVVLTAPNGALLRLPGQVIRQQPVQNDHVLLGVRFSGLSLHAIRALDRKCGLGSSIDIDSTAADSSPSQACSWLIDPSPESGPTLDSVLIYSYDLTDTPPRSGQDQSRGRSALDAMRRAAFQMRPR